MARSRGVAKVLIGQDRNRPDDGEAAPEPEAPPEHDKAAATETAGEGIEEPSFASYMNTLMTGDDREIKDVLAADILRIPELVKLTKRYFVLALIDLFDSINSWHSDRIYNALSEGNAQKSRDILLILVSYGGSAEPAYQMSKLCKQFANKKLVVAVPRMAKSAATLMCLGADEIHMGPLGELGPIDTQLGGLPALGVRDALRTIASLSQDFPGSSSMWAQYLQRAVSVQQIGYYDRITQSTQQYAERLLANKAK